MTPTPEQVAQWAREAGFGPAAAWPESLPPFARLVTRAMAEQAEADAKRVEVSSNRVSAAAAIRANAPKVTT